MPVPSEVEIASLHKAIAGNNNESIIVALSGKKKYVTIILFCVSVSVLSVQITSVLPKAPIAGSLRIIAF